MSPKKIMLDKIMLTLTGIILFFLIISFLGAYISTKPPKIISPITPKDLGLDYKEVTFTTKDKLNLRGWFIPAPAQVNNPKTIILLHGYPADKGNILPALQFLNQKYNLFLFDFRYFGQSEGKYSTAGIKETEDLLAAIRFLKSQGIGEVGVWGFSMGGAVALMTAPEAPEITVIISESSYARLDLLASQLFQVPILKHPLGFLTTLWAKLFLGVDVREISPEKSATKLTIPVLIIHSMSDEVIKFSHALRLKEALKNNPKAEFWFQEYLFHGQLTEEYQKQVEAFFEKYL